MAASDIVRGYGSKYGISVPDSDLARVAEFETGIGRYKEMQDSGDWTKYTSGVSSPEQLDTYLADLEKQYSARSSNTPGYDPDDGSYGGDDRDGGPGGGPSQIDNYPRGTDPAATQRMLDELLANIRNTNQQPDVDVSQIDPGEFPVFEVPGENLSPAIDDVLLDLMEGSDPFGLTERIQGLLDRTEGGGINSERLFQRQEAARENLTRGEMAATADLRGILADRGLLSSPGVPQGMEVDATTRALEPLHRSYLAELRGAFLDESEAADGAESEALQIATGWSKDQVDRRLSAANTAQERQQMMSSIALEVLDKNMTWNKFLAEFGLEREMVQEQIRQGRIDAIMPYVQMFTALVNQSRGGYIGES